MSIFSPQKPSHLFCITWLPQANVSGQYMCSMDHDRKVNTHHQKSLKEVQITLIVKAISSYMFIKIFCNHHTKIDNSSRGQKTSH